MNESKFIDHTLLSACAKREQIKNLCEEAVKYDFASVCVNPYWVKYAYTLLRDTSVKVCTVIGFPLGANAIEVKAYEAKQAILDGADEIDMVINIGEAKDGNFEYIFNEIRTLKEVCGVHTLKVILETCYLTDDEKLNCCLAAKRAKADFVKTSTGFGTGGATLEDVRMMKKCVGEIGVKASGGIRSRESFEAFIEAGATRIGTSSGTKLIGGDNNDSNSTY